ncbi:protein S40-4-like [Tasmannia lanceolata]|uniref:protein S40-4-like n=1 Tax=Tasmannia lanceolata TaxID=3420 RepID=UPI00406423DA
MAGKNYLSKPTYRFFTENPLTSNTVDFEFDEADVWNSHPLPPETKHEFKKQIPSFKITKKPTKRSDGDRTAASSLPVNIPDWSKILREDSRRREFVESDEVELEGDDEIRVPPHEFLAKQFPRTQIASFSVHEGIGRTLKGRDLSRVRNAIWEKTGFQD